MTDTAEIFGKVVGLEVKETGWTQFNVQVEGDKYPTPVSTKIDDIIAQGKEALTWPFAHVRYKPSTNINPNTNKPYRGGTAAEFLPATPADVEKAQTAAKDNGGSGRAADGEYLRRRHPAEALSIERQSSLGTAFEYAAFAFAKTWEGSTAELELYLFGLATRLEAHVSRSAEDTPADDDRPPLTDSDAPDIDPDLPF